MSETVERNNRFYEQPNGEMLTENEQLKEWLVIANKRNDELQKERDMYKGSFETMSENYFKLENIIKEVREKVSTLNATPVNCEDYELRYGDYDITLKIKKELLEILDKENI